MKYEDKYAGFAFVREIEQGNKQYYSMAEFFVMKKYRRSGLGRVAAVQLFNRFRGEWEVSQIKRNQPAKKFWRSMIEEFTNGSWTEVEVESRSIQRFSSY
ncbi:GNAT family N-acetyltransferase [Rossellomorea vietnamensis]|uniref:GNAT family N-acetyltransferase n=1 Tax=Rossellomorea vietnamensis TaxID=218284 RepID=UPI002078C1DF|nr:GNAT family N-acetyltransferase [Rossellomorea vietnamensis]